MVSDLGMEMVNIISEVLEGFLLALVGVKPPKRSRRTARMSRMPRTSRTSRTRRRNTTLHQNRIVLNEHAWLRMSGEIVRELPRDEAITVLNAIQHYAVNA